MPFFVCRRVIVNALFPVFVLFFTILASTWSLPMELAMPSALPSTNVPSLSGSTFDRFLGWLDENDAELDDVLIIPSPLGLPSSAILKRNASEGDILIRLPRKLLFTQEVFGASTLKDGEAARPFVDQFSTDELLVLGLLAEYARGVESFWAPWIAMLPRKIPGQPFFYTKVELQGLSKSYAELEVNKNGHEVVRLFQGKIANATSSLIPEGFDSLQRICWAFSIVWSRTIFLAGKDGTRHEFMAPVLDSFAADGDTSVSSNSLGQLGLRFANSNSVLEAISARGIASSSPLLFSFSPDAPNAVLLLRHGRPKLNNSNDYLPLSFTNPPEEELYEIREHLLASLSISMTHHLRVGSLPPGLHECAVVLTMDKEDIVRVRNTPSGLDLNVCNTTRGLHQLQAALETMLARYPHSRTEDETVLASGVLGEQQLSKNMEMVLRVRIGEKMILEDSILRVQKAITSGGLIESNFLQEADRMQEINVADDFAELVVENSDTATVCPCSSIYIHSARRLPKSDSGGAFGWFGSADPFVKVLLGEKELGRTTGAKGTENPKWLYFRSWLLSDAPDWLVSLYREHGEDF